MQTFPFISLSAALVVLRIATAGLIMAHAVIRIFNKTIPRFGEFMTKAGFPKGELVVWAITAYEIIGGILMAIGYQARFLALGFFIILAVGIVLIHRHLGWFVGEHGTGGSEYSVSLMVALIVIAAADASALL